MMRSTTSEGFFEAMYRADQDPWNFTGSDYELRRYHAVVAALGQQRIHFAVEPGCSVGVLTEMIAGRCDRVLAIDISPTAVERAALRCARFPHVSVTHQSLTDVTPHDADLLLLCEVGYYFEPAALQQLTAAYIEALAPGATVLACHWLGHSPDHLMHGDQVHQILHGMPGLVHEFAEREREFRIDRWRKATP